MEYMIWIWLGAAVVFGILEAMTAGLISVWFVAGAVAAMAAAMLEADVMVQAGVFIVVSALALALTRPLVRRWTQTRTVATNADRVLGQMAKVTETVDNDNSMGAVYVDGQALDEPYTFEPTYLSYAEYGKALDYPVTVPEGELFVMGDNRNHSEDSRFSDVGCVKKEAVLGKVLFVVFPGRQTNEYGTVTGGRSWHRFGAVS